MHTSLDQRARIVTLREEGHSARKVASMTGVSHTTVLRVCKQFNETGSLENQPRSGRPRSLSVRQERQLARAVRSGRISTALEASSQLTGQNGSTVSVQTVRRALRHQGLRSYVKKRKPLLTRTHRKRRCEFARKHQDWSIDDWKCIIWTDESKFNLFGSDGKEYYWKKPTDPLKASHVKPCVQKGGGNVMVWACMTWEGIGYLVKIDNGLDGHLYRDILKCEFLNSVDWYDMDRGSIILQQDNDPKHTCKVVRNWLVKSKLKVLDWPSRSPDLNPIEHLWAEVELRLRRLVPPPTSLRGLWDKLQDVWNGVEVEVCRRLILTMPERIQAVIKAKGGHTRW